MSTLLGVEIREFPATRVIGKQVVCSFGKDAENPGPALWESMISDGTLNYLQNLPQRATADPDAIGWMGEYNPVSNTYLYIAGILAKPNTPVPNGYVFRDIPACKMAVASIRGTDEDHDVYEGAHDHVAGAMHERGYEYDDALGGFEMEYFSHARFVLPLARGEKYVILDYYSPCRKQRY